MTSTTLQCVAAAIASGMAAVAAGQTCGADPNLGTPGATNESGTTGEDDAFLGRIAALEKAIAEAEQQQAWLADQRAEEIRRCVLDVLADADTRASMPSAPISAGYDDDFFIESGDGRFRLEISGQLQFRFVYNRQKNTGTDDDRWGIEGRRIKLKFDGHLHAPEKIAYSIMGAFDRDEGAFELQDAAFRFRLSDDLKLQVGRARSTLLREEDVSSKRQLLVERSLIARAFSQERAQGAALKYEGEQLRASLGFADTTRGLFSLQGWQAAGRIELLMECDDWDVLEDFTSHPDDDSALAVGAGILFAEIDLDEKGDDQRQTTRWTADVSGEFGGASLFAAVVGNHPDDGSGALDQYGFIMQAGLFVTDDLELVGQYVWGEGDGEAEELSVITVGVNRYLDRHILKWTTDVGYAFDEVGKLWSSNGAGWRTDAPGQEGQLVVRTQFQLLF